MKPLKPYTVEVFSVPPAFMTRVNPMTTAPRMRVRPGTFEENRDTMSASLYHAEQVAATCMDGAKARAREVFAKWQRERRNAPRP